MNRSLSSFVSVTKSSKHTDMEFEVSDFDLGKFCVKDVILRQASPDDLSWLLKEDELLDWHTTPSAIKLCLEPGFTDCFIVAQYGKETIGSIMGYEFTEKDVYVGFYVVTERLRGRGVGKLLWNRLVEFAKGRTLWMWSERHNLEMYTRKGFGTAQPKMKVKHFSFAKLVENLPENNIPGLQIEEIKESNLGKIVDYDSEICGFRREKFWQQWLSIQVRPGLVAFKEGKVHGFVFLSDQNANLNHYRCEPLFANDADTARSLLLKIVGSVPKDSTFGADFNLKSHCTELVKDIFNLNDNEDAEGTVLTALTTGKDEHSFNLDKVFFITQIDTVLV